MDRPGSAADLRSTSLVGAIDEGTSSTRFLVFSSKTFDVVAYHQIRLQDIRPEPGWIEMDPMEILNATKECITKTCDKLADLKFDARNIRAIGVTNQRETTVVWDRRTGTPLYNAIVWCDTRTEELAEIYGKKCMSKDAFQKRCGLVIHPYFSALKLRWLLDNVPEVQIAAKEGYLMFGTVDTWLIWNLTGGSEGGIHVTDVSNASRTMLMNIRTLQWDLKLLKFFDIDPDILCEIRSSSEIYGKIQSGGPLQGVPISGCLGDQQAALVGESCFEPEMCKSTFGTGCFLLANTDEKLIFSKHGLLTTVAYKFGPEAPTFYALEGSIAVAGACLDWLGSNLGFFDSYEEREKMLQEYVDTGGVYLVPAFSGLYAPYWHPQARGLIVGITAFTTKAHILRAAYEAICYQTRDILEAMRHDNADSPSLSSTRLFADGGLAVSDHFMQMLTDLVGAKVSRAKHPEATSLGAAIAAGLASGINIWTIEEIKQQPLIADDFMPSLDYIERNDKYEKWKDAVIRTKYWTHPRSLAAESWSKLFVSITVPGSAFLAGALITFAMLKYTNRWN